MDDYTRGQWLSLNRVLDLLNTFETREISKSELYHAIFDIRPMKREIVDHVSFRDLWRDDRLEEIEDNIDDGWRHGNYHDTVYELLDENENKTGKFYMASYRVSGDGEYHGIRENDFEFCEVTPREVVVTKTVWDVVKDGAQS